MILVKCKHRALVICGLISVFHVKVYSVSNED